jgi:hypothetical protein
LKININPRHLAAWRINGADLSAMKLRASKKNKQGCKGPVMKL